MQIVDASRPGSALLVSESEVGHRLGLAPTAVSRLADAGQLRRVRVGRRVLIVNESVDELVSGLVRGGR